MCGTVTSYMTNQKAMSEQEALGYAPEIKKVLPPLEERDRAELEADWAWLRVEVERRGGRWTLADLIEEGVPRPDREAA